jgi:hypothetical protein
MRNLIIGVAAVGAVVGLVVVGRRVGHKVHAHCAQMVAQCKQTMAGQFEERGEATEAREHCGHIAGQSRRHGETAETQEHSEQQAPQLVGQGEAVGAA